MRDWDGVIWETKTTRNTRSLRHPMYELSLAQGRPYNYSHSEPPFGTTPAPSYLVMSRGRVLHQWIVYSLRQKQGSGGRPPFSLWCMKPLYICRDKPSWDFVFYFNKPRSWLLRDLSTILELWRLIYYWNLLSINGPYNRCEKILIFRGIFFIYLMEFIVILF